MDNLNSIDYVDFFEEIELPDEDKEKRIELAERIDDVYFWLFSYITVLLSLGEVVDTSSLIMSVEYRLYDLMDTNIRYVPEHIVRLANETVTATIDNAEDSYYLSDKRASEIAANESHTYFEYEELQEAWDSGKTKKTWHTKQDRKVRRSHRVLDGKTIPIEELFEVNGSYMMVPKDTENGASLTEISNCRCWATYRS